MDFNDLASSLVGNWSGQYSLWLHPSQPAKTSESKIDIQLVVLEKFLRCEYTWEIEGKTEEGILTVGYDSIRERVISSWIDSWHQSSDFMLSEGSMSDQGLSVKGSYNADKGPRWEWRTKIKPKSASVFVFEMYNITPWGEEALAVQVEYKRITKQNE